MRIAEDEQEIIPEDPDGRDLPWPMEELSLAETWWLLLGTAVNLTQIGDATWNKVPTRS